MKRKLQGYYEELQGWAMVARANSLVYRPRDTEDILQCFETARKLGRKVGFRGAGRSYGDPGLNTNQIIIDLTRMNHILGYDPQNGIITVEPGVTIEQLWKHVIADGWWPEVVPGTMKITIGGGAAMNVHGKNNWQVGTFGEYITRFKIMLPSGEEKECSPEQNPELFYAAVGSFGVLGAFTSITLHLRKIYSGKVEVFSTSCSSLSKMFVAIEKETSRSDDIMGWIDVFAGGNQLGRGIVNGARELGEGEDKSSSRSLAADCQTPSSRVAGLYPKSMLWPVLKFLAKNWSMRWVNRAQYYLTRFWGNGRASLQSLVTFHFKLDYVPNFKYMYKPHGLMQYQVFVPTGHAEKVMKQILGRSQEENIIPYLAVLKKHKADNKFLLPYVGDGYSLALDYPVTASNRGRLNSLFTQFNQLVFEHGGKFYPAKDYNLTAEDLTRTYPEDKILQLLEMKKKCDPEDLLTNNLFTRLFAKYLQPAEQKLQTS